MTPAEQKILLDKYLSDSLTPEEFVQFQELLKQSGNTVVEAVWNNTALHGLSDARQKQLVLEKLLRRPAPVRKLVWIRYAAAIVVLISIGAYLWNTQIDRNTTEQVAVNPYPLKTDVAAPTAAHAMITLADGKTIVLDSSPAGVISLQDRVSVQKKADGQIVYTGEDGTTRFNTLVNPRGSRMVSLTLADGSRVWLNAESSLTYPVAFSGRERVVELSGEGYFEVAKDPSRKFIVKAQGLSTEVLGTHFNVHAYPKEQDVRTTLLEGSVQLLQDIGAQGQYAARLRPGEQGILKASGEIHVQTADVEAVMAWKNGRFRFEEASLDQIMQELSRVYAVDVQYEGPVNEQFSGDIDRAVNLSQALHMLELTGKVHFRIENNTVYVKP